MTRVHAMVLAGVLGWGTQAFAQTARPPRRPMPPPLPPPTLNVSGFVMLGSMNFTAAESFDAILGSSSGSIFGGGVRVGLPWGGLFVNVGASRFHAEGERALVFDNEVIPLGIPVEVTVIPIEIGGGWRFRFRRAPKLIPYVGGGFTATKYEETSDSSTASEELDETFSGYHLLGGAEYKIMRWLGVAGEASWTTVPDAIGEAGVSEAFNETDLGGMTFRFKINVGR
jgi:hypothetical protein